MERYILENLNRMFGENKIPTKIKMKQKVYDEIAIRCSQIITFSEVLDQNYQPLNTFAGLKVEIDDSIKDDYEFVYEKGD